MRLGVRDLVRTAVLAALAVGIQSLNLPQPVTGPAINSVLFIATMYVGTLSGILVGLLTPWVALLTGILKLAPAVPVIMAGNASLCLTAGLGQRVNRYLAVAAAAVVKFTVMTIGVKLLVASGTKIPAAAYTSLTITQLFTACGGALIALAVLGVLERLKGSQHGNAGS